jgi:hypothetical protein
MGILWELDKNSTPHLFKKIRKHLLEACWCHPIGSPHKLYSKVLFRNKLLG